MDTAMPKGTFVNAETGEVIERELTAEEHEAGMTDFSTVKQTTFQLPSTPQETTPE